MSLSVLQNKKNIILKNIPFPYLIVDNALPNDIYDELDNSFPEYDKIIKLDRSNKGYQENTAYRYSAYQSLIDSHIPKIWKDFIFYHTSADFCHEVFEIFSDGINKIYKTTRDKLPKEENIGIRFKDKKNFSTDCQFVINTPTSGDTTVIEPHLDNAKEFYAGLLYMKGKEDLSKGGNLTTHSFIGKPSFYGNSRVRESNSKLIEEIEYKANRFVLFLNSPLSIHGVTKREKTETYRKYMNIIGEFNHKLFDYRPFLEK